MKYYEKSIIGFYIVTYVILMMAYARHDLIRRQYV